MHIPVIANFAGENKGFQMHIAWLIISAVTSIALKFNDLVRRMWETKEARQLRERDKAISRLIRKLTGTKNPASIAFSVDTIAQELRTLLVGALDLTSEGVLDSLIRLQNNNEVYEDQYGWHAGSGRFTASPRFKGRWN